MRIEQQPQGVSGKIKKLDMNQVELSPEQQALSKDCGLNIKWRTALGGLVVGSQRVITGTIEGGKKVEIIFDPSYLPDWRGGVEAKIKGKSVSSREAERLRDKYRAIAEFQTREA